MGKLKPKNNSTVFFKKLMTAIIATAFVLVCCVGYVFNIVKLSECDFEKPYKAEVIHSIGIIPIIGVVTGWLDLGK